MVTRKSASVFQHLRNLALLRDGASLTDGQLLESFISSREDAAFEAVVRRHGPMVMGVCCRLLHNRHDAEDAFQATFLVLLRKAVSIASRELLANWLYGVAYNTALKAKAAAAKRTAREKQVTEMPEPKAVQQNLWHDLQPLLDHELSRLPDKYRIPIVLCDLEGKTRKEAARHLGWPEGTVAGRLARARTMLAKRLTQRGVMLAGGSLAAVLSQNSMATSLSPLLVVATVKAASLFGTGKTGMISVQVAALAEGVLKSMMLTKLKTLTVGLAVLAAFGGGVGTYSANHGFAQQPGNQNKTIGVEQGIGARVAPTTVEGAVAHFQSTKAIEPTEAELQAAIRAFEKLGGRFRKWTDPQTKKVICAFQMPQETNDNHLKKLPMVPFLFGLDLRFAHVTDIGLKELGKINNLSLLYLQKTYVTDIGLKELANLRNLSGLYLWNTNVTDAGLKDLAKINNLSTLSLKGTMVTDAGLKELAKLKNLSSLDLSSTKVTDAGLKDLAELKNLLALNINSTSVTDAGLKEIAKLKNLSTLNLSDTNITDTGLKEVANLKSLSALNLSFSKVTDAGLKELANLKNLSTLCLGGTQMTDAGLKELANLKNLARLLLNSFPVTDAGLKELANVENLSEIQLTNTPVTDAGLKELANLKNLSSLTLSSSQVTDAGLKELANLKNLSSLTLGIYQMTDAGMKELANLKNLSSLSLYCRNVTDVGLRELAKLKNLSPLSLSGARVTDLGLLKELANLKNLSLLDFSESLVKDAGVRELQMALPNCEIRR